MPWSERTSEPRLHVRRGPHHLFCQTRLTNPSNRDGRNLTINSLVGATQHVYRLTKPLAYLLAITGVFLCGDGRTVDLHRLAKHGVIEHDASLSRQDTEPPNKYAPTTVDPELVDELMHTSPNDFLVLNDLAAARVSRESQARGGPLDFIHAEIGSAESALILQVFGDEKLEVEKDVLRDWFIDGRLPDSWKCPERMIGLLTSMSVTKRVKNAMASIRNPKSA